MLEGQIEFRPPIDVIISATGRHVSANIASASFAAGTYNAYVS